MSETLCLWCQTNEAVEDGLCSFQCENDYYNDIRMRELRQSSVTPPPIEGVMSHDSREDIDLDWWGSADAVEYEDDDSPPYPHDLDGAEHPEFDG